MLSTSSAVLNSVRSALFASIEFIAFSVAQPLYTSTSEDIAKFFPRTCDQHPQRDLSLLLRLVITLSHAQIAQTP